MNYHLFIQSAPNSENHQSALTQAKILITAHVSIKQIFFYSQGIQQILDMTLAKEWDKLVQSQSPLKVCKTAWENEQSLSPPPSGFVLSSLIDFFTQHWKDQGILLQL